MVWQKAKKCKVMKSEADFGFYMYVCYDRPLVTLICIPKTNKQKFGHVLEFGHRIVKEIQGFSVRFVGEYMELSPLVCEDDAHRACSQVC